MSQSAANTRTSVWYTANLARAPGDVYIAPSGVMAGRACLVVEVSGLGPWDTVAGINTNYAAAATSLALSLGAPSAQALIIGAVCGDNSAATQAFAPASWTTLPTVNANNGADHTCDAYLTSAWIVTSGSVSVAASAVTATDLSGVLISVLTSAASPIPAGQNPAWPYTRVEAAFGAGYQTPPDQVTWTDLTGRCWSWEETSGVQYELGQIQATDLVAEFDNNDGLLSADNPAAYFYTAAGANWSPDSAFYDQAVSAGVPLAWWKLADAAGSASAADSSGNSHPATATSVTFGNASQAVSGNNSASFASASSSHCLSSYNPALTAVTAEGWVNLNSLSQSGNPLLIANSNTASDHKGFTLGMSGTTPQVSFGNTTTSATVTAASALPAAGWTYLAATWDGTTVTLYVNGVSQGTAALSGSMPAGTATGIGLGYNPATSSGFLNGLLAECAVYGTALTATQIAAHYTAGPAATGTPLRIRAAIGAIGGQTVNRWYVICRNAHEWPQQITQAYRRYATVTGTDIWAATSAYGPSPYRGEILQDLPYAWWPCDDQPAAAGILPTSLRNAAPGNTSALNIVLSPNGAVSQLVYDTAGDAPPTNATAAPVPQIAQYAVGQNAGWMYGDPASSPLAAASATGVVTAQPGSASWTQSGVAGNTGSDAFFLSVNDTAFPPLSGGITVEGWFNCPFFGTANGYNATIYGTNGGDATGQPYCNMTIAELATSSAAVAVLQMDRSTGHLALITYNGATPTTNNIYTTADLRTGSWHHFAVTLTTTTWTVYLDGGQTAKVSGTATGMTSAWTYLLGCGDTGTAGGAGTASIARSGNMSLAHLAVYPSILPPWRITAHYWAAITAFGLLPAPQGIASGMAGNSSGTIANTNAPDGSIFQGSYTGGASPATATISAIVTANAGSYTSGPSAWSPTAAIGTNVFAWVQWTTGVAPLFTIYTAASHGSEKSASTTIGAVDAYTSGYGATAAGAGRCHAGAGAGASPPSSPTATGDTVAQRLERILSYAGTAGLAEGGVSSPCRCIDPASLAVQAATDIGGQQTGQNLQNVASSDGGWLFVDNLGNLTYWQKSHLAAQYTSPAWTLTPGAPPTPGGAASAVPYQRDLKWSADPQRVWNAITITPFSPDGASLPLVIPSNTTSVVSSQQQYGAQPFQITSYLQSTTEMASQANWLLANFGQVQVRVENLEADAAAYPAAWPFVLGANIADVISVQNWAIGNTGVTGTFRISSIRRDLRFAGQDAEVRATLIIQGDYEPLSYWT